MKRAMPLALFSIALVSACGEDGGTGGPGSPDLGVDRDTGGPDAAAPDAGADMALGDVGASDLGSSDMAQADGGGGDTGGMDMGRAGDPTTDAAFSQAAQNLDTWVWVPVEGAVCRDGSPTGFLVREQADSERWVIYFQGGGACFNRFTCASNPARFGADDATGFGANRGLFDADSETNPVADWNFAFVPYCTGDVHAGTRRGVAVPGVAGAQDFVGGLNAERYLAILAEARSDAAEILVTGSSAGGFGSLLNYGRVRDAFPGRPAHLLDDSGQFLAYGPALAPCLVQSWFDLWQVEAPSGCTRCRPENDGMFGVAAHWAEVYPDANLGLFSYLEDRVIRTFFLFGKNDCNPTDADPIPADDFSAAVLDLRDLDGWSTFFLDGPSHTVLGGAAYEGSPVDGVTVADWLGDLLDGQASDVGPAD